jgi:hypothetical protein
VTTEIRLREWRNGHTLAERLCAGIMAVEGFTDIDPQAPLGGPDDKKDILARRNDLLWLGAVFFPPTQKTFAEVRTKLQSDLEGVSANAAQAFAFFVNQPLTVGQREELRGIGPAPTEIYHLERLRSILDSPIGYGLRLEFLAITMGVEEQASFVVALQQGMSAQLSASQDALAKVQEQENTVLERTIVIGAEPSAGRSSITLLPSEVGVGNPPLAALSMEMLFFIHRLVAPDSLLPDTVASQLRPVAVAVGETRNPRFVPPEPAEVPDRVVAYIEWWRALYPQLVAADADLVLDALVELHHRFVSIHPFLDGNGRVARALLDQAARELLARPVGPGLTAEPAAYFAALRAADAGNAAPLRELIRDSLQ